MESVTLFKRNPGGSRRRYVRNLYAYRVSHAMTGEWGVCPACGIEFLCDNDGQVDRTYPRDDYRTGEIVYLCGGCNQSRANNEWRQIEEYRRLVREASEGIEIPTEPEAAEWWANRRRHVRKPSRWA